MRTGRGISIASGLVLAGLLLSACAGQEVILPGIREDVRGVLQNPEPIPAAQTQAPEVNRAAPIRLPAQRNNAAWPQRAVSPLYRTDNATLGGSLQLAWSTDIGDGDSRRFRISADPVVAGGRVFTMDSRSLVSATSASGQHLWSHDVKPAQARAGSAGGGALAYGDGRLFVTSGYGRLVALDPETGAELWTQDLDASATGNPTYFGGLVYLVAGDRTAWAVEADTGRIRWQNDSIEDVSNIYGGPAPALTEDLAIFGYGSGEVQAAFRKGGLTRWTASVVGAREGRARSMIDDITGDPVVDGNRVYVGNQSGRLVALNRDSGERIWTAKFGTMGPVWPAGGSIFLVSDLGELLRVDASDGSRIWGVELPGFVRDRVRKRAEIYTHHGPILAGNRIIVASGDGYLRQFDPVSGRLLAATELPGGATSAPVVAGGTLYVVSKRGQLLAFR
ncbi:PQQ-binding-like beta-propeller repeat protein [Aquicoccus sp. SCR17]|nr:PQQ-binding-like beta-propeller repeat protein [Carideicomes alvinocaridis]